MASLFQRFWEAPERGPASLTKFRDPQFPIVIPVWHTATSWGLFGDDANESVRGWLSQRGQTSFLQPFQKWQELLDAMQANHLDAWQSFDGLESLTRFQPNPDEQMITITVRDAVDWRASALASIKHLIFDQHRRAWRVPPNLARFSMTILVRDVRWLGQGYAEQFGETSWSGFPINGKPDWGNWQAWSLGGCEFVWPETESLTESDNFSPEPRTRQLQIKFKRAVEHYQFYTIGQGQQAVGQEQEAQPAVLTEPTGEVTPTIEREQPRLRALASTEELINQFSAASIQRRLNSFGDELQRIGETRLAAAANSLLSRASLGNIYQNDFASFVNLATATSVQEFANSLGNSFGR